MRTHADTFAAVNTTGVIDYSVTLFDSDGLRRAMLKTGCATHTLIPVKQDGMFIRVHKPILKYLLSL